MVIRNLDFLHLNSAIRKIKQDFKYGIKWPTYQIIRKFFKISTNSLLKLLRLQNIIIILSVIIK
jgi:hypothetical protein